MNPKLAAILKKSKAIDKAARAFDTDPLPEGNSRRTPSRRKSSGGGLYDDIGNHGGQALMEGVAPNERADVESEMYNDNVMNSGLPPEIQKAMISNPIPQPSSVVSMDQDMVNEIRGEEEFYNEDDGYDVPEKLERRPKRQVIREEQSMGGNVSPELIRSIVNEEIKKILPKVLPKVVEHYLQKGLLKESMDILKNVKTTSVKKRR
jgi:hypothetical protein